MVEESKLRRALALLKEVEEGGNSKGSVSDTYQLLKQAADEIRQKESELEKIKAEQGEYNTLKKNYGYLEALTGKNVGGYLKFARDNDDDGLSAIVEKWESQNKPKEESKSPVEKPAEAKPEEPKADAEKKSEEKSEDKKDDKVPESPEKPKEQEGDDNKPKEAESKDVKSEVSESETVDGDRPKLVRNLGMTYREEE